MVISYSKLHNGVRVGWWGRARRSAWQVVSYSIKDSDRGG